MDAGGLVSGDEGVAVPLVVVAVRVAVKQIRKNIAQRGVAIDMVVGGPGSENNARATVVDGLVVVQVVVAGGGSAKYPHKAVHGEDVVIDMRVRDGDGDGELQPNAEIIETRDFFDVGVADAEEDYAALRSRARICSACRGATQNVLDSPDALSAIAIKFPAVNQVQLPNTQTASPPLKPP